MQEDYMKEIIEKVYEEIKRRCYLPTNFYGVGAWDHHIEVVYKIAIANASKYKADKDIVAIAALLHDIASVTDKKHTEEHHIIGAQIAEELLTEYGLEKEKIELVKKCILNHRGSRLMEKTTPEEICISDADAMAHFYSVPSLLEMVYVEKKLSINEGAEFVLNKLGRSYNKLSDQGKELVKDRYEAAKLLLGKKGENE